MAIFTAAVAAIGKALTAVAIKNFLIKTAAQLFTSFLVSKLTGGKSGPAFSVSGKLEQGEEIPRGAPFGKSMTGGSLVFHNSWGQIGKTPNAYYTRVIALSDLPVKGLLRVMVNGAWVTLLSPAHAEFGHPVSEFRRSGADFLWVKFYDGTQTTADAFLQSKVANSERPWASTRVGVGMAYAVITARANSSLFSGFPDYRFELDSVRLYDISKDTTAGGSGLQRWNNPATWGGDGDYLPAVQGYNILRGVSYGGEWIYGFQGMSAGRLPSAAWVAAANKCRATVTIPDVLENASTGATSGAGTDVMFRSGGFLTFDTECGSAIEAIFAAAAGRVSDSGGIYTPSVGAPDAAVVAVTMNDIISTEPQSFSPVKGLAGSINAIMASYPEPEDGYAIKSVAPLLNPDFEAQDGGRRLPSDLSLSNVPYAAQVQRLQALALAEVRRTRRHVMVLSPKFNPLEPGDVLTLTDARHGYVAKSFRVNAAEDMPDCNVLVDIVEVDPADYNFTGWTGYAPVIVTQPVVPVLADDVLPGWTVTAGVVADATSTARRPALVFGWDASELIDTDTITVEWRVKTTTNVLTATTADISANSLRVSEGVLPSTTYEARAIVNASRPVAWTAWAEATTEATLLTSTDISPSVTNEIIAAAETALAVDYQAAQAAAADAIAAAASAGDDAAAAVLAALAASTSATNAAGSASTASTQATNAATSATAAGNSASAASTSASTATTKATEAATSATAANTAKVAAETAKGAAQASQTAAATSATDAAGSASTAATQATNSANSATAAGGSATAASTSASLATTKATEASGSATAAATSATAANSSKVAAETAAGAASVSQGAAATSATSAAGSATSAATSATTAARLSIAAQGGPGVLQHGLDHFTASVTGDPATVALIATSATYAPRLSTVTSTDSAVGGKDVIATGYVPLYSVNTFQIDPARKYRIRARVKRDAIGTGTPLLYVGRNTLGAGFAAVGANGGHQYPTAALSTFNFPVGGWTEFVSPILTGTGITSVTFPSGSTQIRLLAFLNYNGGDHTSGNIMRLSYLALEDVTDFENISAEVDSNTAAIATVGSSLATFQTSANAQFAALDTDLGTVEGSVTSLSATVTAQGTAFADLEGAIGTYAIGASVPGGSADITLTAVKLSDGTPAASKIKLRSDVIEIDGLTAFSGEYVGSTAFNATPGSETGWRAYANGNFDIFGKLKRKSFALGELQLPMPFLDVEPIETSQAAFQFKRTGPVMVVAMGGGGSGGAAAARKISAEAIAKAAAGGGGCGGLAVKFFNVTTLTDTYTITIGAGGAAKTASVSITGGITTQTGDTGGVTSFVGAGLNISCTGGLGGQAAANNNSSAAISCSGGVGGIASGGDLNFTGGKGGDASCSSALYATMSASGGGGGQNMGLISDASDAPAAAQTTAGTLEGDRGYPAPIAIRGMSYPPSPWMYYSDFNFAGRDMSGGSPEFTTGSGGAVIVSNASASATSAAGGAGLALVFYLHLEDLEF